MKSVKIWLVAVLTMVVLGAFGVGAALADSSTTTSSVAPPAPPQSQQELTTAFLSSLASTLGISTDTLTTDLETAYTSALSEEVTAGTITQAQADKLLVNLDKDGTSFLTIMAGGGPGGQGGPGGPGGQQPSASTNSSTTSSTAN
jgi:hypothetical protein